MPTPRVIDTLFSMESPSTIFHLSKCGDTVADCVAAMDEACIHKVVLAPCKRQECERHWMCDDIQMDEVQHCVMSRPDRFAGLAAYNPHAIGESMQELERVITQWHFRGVYIVWDGTEVKLLDACMYPLYARCVELDVPLMLAVSNAGESAILSSMRILLRDFPELRVILAWATAANVDVMVAACNQHPTLAVAFDGRVAAGQESTLRDWLTTDGEYRCMWGSNGMSWKRLLQHVSSYSLPEAVLNSLLYENALRAFRLSEAIKTEIPLVNDRIIVAE